MIVVIMKRLTFISFLVLFLFSCLANAETIDVRIKGFDDGVKTTQRQDYKEAALFAKREAIERAGVKVESITKVEDFVLLEDYIETQAEAVLMPGYEIIDIGYNERGAYVVVLIGKVKTGTSSPNGIMTEDWHVQKEDLKFINDKIVCVEDGFRLVQVYDEKTHRIGKWKIYAKLKIHRSLHEEQSKYRMLKLSYCLLDMDTDSVTCIFKDIGTEIFTLPLLDPEFLKLKDDAWYEVRLEETGEIRPEDVERVRSRGLKIALPW